METRWRFALKATANFSRIIKQHYETHLFYSGVVIGTDFHSLL